MWSGGPGGDSRGRGMGGKVLGIESVWRKVSSVSVPLLKKKEALRKGAHAGT